MRRSLVVVAALILATLAVVPAAVAGNPELNFGTHLSSAPGADSSGQGQGLVRFESDLESAYFKLNVANIENVTMAHIHVADTPGGIVAATDASRRSSPGHDRGRNRDSSRSGWTVGRSPTGLPQGRDPRGKGVHQRPHVAVSRRRNPGPAVATPAHDGGGGGHRLVPTCCFRRQLSVKTPGATAGPTNAAASRLPDSRQRQGPQQGRQAACPRWR